MRRAASADPSGRLVNSPHCSMPGGADNRPVNDSRARVQIRESRFWLSYQRQRYAILFYALLLTLIAMPIATTMNLPATLIRLMLGACLLAALLPNATRRTRTALIV